MTVNPNMTLEEAIEIFEKIRDTTPWTNERFDATVIALSAMYEKQKPSDRWIPCAERLPERAGIYLITYKESSEHLGIEWERDVCRARFTKLGWTFNRMACRNVLAWQDLPQPWKGE